MGELLAVIEGPNDFRLIHEMD